MMEGRGSGGGSDYADISIDDSVSFIDKTHANVSLAEVAIAAA
jgi:hypothetical protein